MKKNFLMTLAIGLMVLLITGYRLQAKSYSLENHLTEDSVDNKYHDPGMEKVIQIAIVVKDIEAAAKHWAELLCKPVPEIRTTRPGNEVKVKDGRVVIDSEYDIVLLGKK